VSNLEELIDRFPDRYDIQSEIGRGGMAVVYRATDRRNSRDVAIKVLRPELSASLGVKRFLREITITANLQHPNILTLIDSGEVNGIPYYVMPLVEGETLRQKLDRVKQLPVEEALQVARDVGDALSYAHNQNLIHRDVKPANIFVSSGHAILADFGVARAYVQAGGESITETGYAIGTVEYMSPEQAGGDSGIDQRSDQYALACVVYEMLGGEPPFTGHSARAIVAKHMQERVPSLDVIRPGTRLTIIQAIERALSKVAADRYESVTEFIADLEKPEPKPGFFKRHPVGSGALGVSALAVVVALALLLRPEPVLLDLNKVTVFPLVEQGLATEGDGYGVTLLIEAALEHADPLRWIDAVPRLDERELTSPQLISAGTARSIARVEGARYYITGAVNVRADSTTVIVRLMDAAGDSLVGQNSRSGANDEIALHQLGIDAVKGLLPILVDPARQIDLAPLRNRDAGAIALWIQGERHYRKSQFGQALDFYQRALAQDSLLVFAAFKGAQAANWTRRWDDARVLVEIAQAHPTLLPLRHALFARGLRAYLAGMANSAVTHFQAALAEDPDWAEAQMALGEVFYHLLPDHTPLDSLAQSAFEASLEADSLFAAPLYHLTEIALRRGKLDRARFLIDRFTQSEPDPTLAAQLALMLECVGTQSGTTDWEAEFRRDRTVVLSAAKSLSAGAYQATCSEQAFRALLEADSATAGERWAGLFGLTGVLVSQGRDSEIVALIDSVIDADAAMGGARFLHFIATAAGVHVLEGAEERAREAQTLFGNDYERASPRTQWILGEWHAFRRESGRLRTIYERLAARAADPGPDVGDVERRRTDLYARSLEAQLTLVEGDTARAVRQLEALAPTAPHDQLSWDFADPLPIERLTLASLYLARGDYLRADSVAAVFDHQEPVVYLPFVAASLSIRYQAAQRLDRRDLLARYAERLRRLGRVDLLATSR